LFLADLESGESVWKVLDFGVATLAEHSGTLTQGNVVGTPTYMAPEQACGLTADHRADVYAIAAIAYRWLTGRPAFYGKDIPSILYRVVHTMPRRPSTFGAHLAPFDAVLAIGLAKSPGDRFDQVSELADVIDAAIAAELDHELLRRADLLVANHPWSS